MSNLQPIFDPRSRRDLAEGMLLRRRKAGYNSIITKANREPIGAQTMRRRLPTVSCLF
jgi:hypothetical protein